MKLLRKLTQRSEAKTPYAFSDEVLNGFKNKFGKFYGTDHLVSEGWLSYQASMQPQSDDGVRLCFHSGAMAMFETMQDIYSEAGDIGRAREKIEEGKPDKLWEGFRNCLADEIDAELLHQYKVAFHGGCWFINVVCFTWDEQQSLGTLASLRDEISEFKTDLKQWTIRVSVDDLVEALVRQAITMNWKQVHEIKRDNVAADSFAQAMVSLRFERGNEEAVVWRKDATVTLVRNYAPRTFDGFDELEQWLAKNPKNNDDGEVSEKTLYSREIEKFIIRYGHFDTLLMAEGTDKEFFFACAKYHEAAYLAGVSANVVALLTLEALRHYQIVDRAIGILMLVELERNCKK